MPFADVPGARLYHEIHGSGPRVLVINGTGSDLRRQHLFDTPLTERFEVLSYDHRGLGQSAPTDPEHQPTMADFGDDALALASAVGWDRFSVIGLSFGGMVAQEVAIRGPQRVERLVLCCTSSGGAGGSSYPLDELWSLPEDERPDPVTLMDTRAAADPEVRARIERWFASQGEGPAAATPGLLKQLTARRGHDTWERLRSIAAPTLVAAGRYDGIAPPDNSLRIAGNVPDARLVEFEGGHAFTMEDPAAWPTICDFLASDR